MRSYAIITAVLAAVTVVGLAGANAFAETTTTNNKNNSPPSVTASAIKYVTVQEGDSLSSIADSNNTTYIRIYDANEQIANPNLIYPGEVLTIPAPGEQLNNRQLPSETQGTISDPVAVPEQDSASPVPVAATVPAPVSNNIAAQPTQAPAVANVGVWNSLAQCESGGNWSIDTGNGFYGGLQFTLSSWQAVGGTGYPNQASPGEQIMRAELLQQQQGWGAWPVCSTELGL